MHGWITLRDVDGGTDTNIHITNSESFRFFDDTIAPDRMLAWALRRVKPHEAVTAYIGGRRRRWEIVEVRRRSAKETKMTLPLE